MRLRTSSLVLWGLYVAFAAYAIVTGVNAATFDFSLPLGGAKAVVWLLLLAFFAYSIYCTFRENFFKTLRSFASLHWGRQIGTDLYLGLFVSLFIIFLNDGLGVALIWLLPTLIYANLTILLYFALNFDAIVSTFLAM